MIIVGIDPGQKGAIAFIDTDKKTKHKEWIIDIPLLPEKGIDAKKINLMLPHTNAYIFLEKAQAMPGQGSVSMFNYGTGYGKILAVLEILGLPFEEIRPNKWKTEFGLSGLKKTNRKEKMTAEEKTAAKKQRKEMAVKIAMQMFPRLKNEFYTSKGKMLDGRAEALLIAAYGARKTGGK
jgi:hypothetical protein